VFAAVHESLVGTKTTCRSHPAMSAFGLRAVVEIQDHQGSFLPIADSAEVLQSGNSVWKREGTFPAPGIWIIDCGRLGVLADAEVVLILSTI